MLHLLLAVSVSKGGSFAVLQLLPVHEQSVNAVATLGPIHEHLILQVAPKEVGFLGAIDLRNPGKC